MSAEANMTTVRQMIERAFNHGDLSAVDELLAPGAVDQQEVPGTNFPQHLKGVVTGLRRAFPDLHFEIEHLMADGEIVAMHSVMTGTHLGRFREMPATGRSIRVRHMHFVQVVDGRGTALWHLWDTPAMMRQLGAGPVQESRSS